jgi:TM2 domain-containing membrane protein YozV
LIFCWTFIPFAISIVEALYFLLIPEKEFDVKYNYDYIMKNKNLNDLQLNK